MTKQDLMEEIFQLSIDERIDLVGKVWNAIARDPETVPIPDWHLRILNQREEASEPRYLTWDQVRKELRTTE